MGIKISTLFILLITTFLTVDGGTQRIPSQLPVTFGGNIASAVLRNMVELWRQGLMEGGVSKISVPAVDWSVVDGNYIDAVIRTMDIVVSGIPGFNVKTLSSSLTKMQMEVDVEFPVIEVSGNYTINIKFLSIIPISWGGTFSLKFRRLELSGAGRLTSKTFGTSAFVEISNPFVALHSAAFTFNGFPGNTNLINLICAVSASLLTYTITIIILALFFKSIKKKIQRTIFTSSKAKSISES